MAFAPIYAKLGGWPDWVYAGALLLGTVAVLYWLAPVDDRLGRMASLAAFVMLLYLALASIAAYPSPWYFPPLAFTGLLAVFRAIWCLPLGRLSREWAGGVRGLLLAGLVVVLGTTFAMSWRQLAVKQDVIEMGNRYKIGLWLKEHAGKDETVYLEPLGYIGYFSQCIMHDWPGLVSPEVVRLRHAHHDKFQLVMAELKPDWVVARPTDFEQMKTVPWIMENYEFIRTFDVTDRLLAEKDMPGRPALLYDTSFGVFHRKS